MSKITLAKLRTICAPYGIKVEVAREGSDGAVMVEMIAPKGQVFGEIDSHFVSHEYYLEAGQRIDRMDLACFVQDLDTLVDCTHEGCGCHVEGEAA